MKYLILLEIKKITRLGFFRRACLILLAAVVFTAAAETARAETVPDGVWKSFYALYGSDREKLMKDYADMKAHEKEQDRLMMESLSLGQEYRTVPWKSRYGDDEKYTDAALFGELFSQKKFIESGYENSISNVCEEAKKTLRQLTATEGLYAENYQKRVLMLYEKLPSVIDIRLSRPTGWSSWFDSKNRLLFLYAAIMIMTVCAYGYEKGGRAILNTAKYGGTRTAAAKILAVQCVSLLMSIAFCAASIAAIAFTCGGMGDASNALQIVLNMTYVPYPISILGGFFVSVLLITLSAAAFSAVCAAVCASVQNVLGSLAGNAGALAVCFSLTRVPGVVSRVGIFSLGGGDAFFTRFRAVDIAAYPLSEAALALFIAIFVFAAGSVLSAVIYAASRSKVFKRSGAGLSEKIKLFFTRAKTFYQSRIRKSVCPKSIFGFEVIKAVRRRGAAAGLAAAAVLALWLSFGALAPVNSLRESIYREYTGLYGGEVTDEKLESLKSEIEGFEKTIASADQMRDLYESGKIAANEYSDFLSALYKAQTRKSPAETVYARMTRLAGTKGRIIYDTGVVRYLKTDLSLVIFIAAAFIGTLAVLPEYDGSVDFARILKACLYGRKRTFVSKMLLSAAVCALFSLIISAGDLIYVTASYGLPDVSVPLYSLDGYSGNISIALFVALREAFQILSAVTVGLVSLGVFTFVKKSVVSVAVSAGLAVLPSLIGFSQAAGIFDMSSALALAKSASFPVPFAVWLIAAAAVAVCAFFAYCRSGYAVHGDKKHKVKESR